MGDREEMAVVGVVDWGRLRGGSETD